MNHHLSKKAHRRVLGSVAAVIVCSALAIAVPASAAVSVTPNPISVSPGQADASVTINYSGLPANKRLFISQCRKPHSDPTFNFLDDCSNLSEVTINPVDNPTGNGSAEFTVFRGEEPSGDVTWGCYADSDTAASGFDKLTTCYLRITADTQSNNIDAQSAAFTFVEDDPVIPEAPLAIALPLLAAALLGGGIFINRRRTSLA